MVLEFLVPAFAGRETKSTFSRDRGQSLKIGTFCRKSEKFSNFTFKVAHFLVFLIEKADLAPCPLVQVLQDDARGFKNSEILLNIKDN